MAHSAPGRHERIGISLVGLINRFPNDETAREWIESIVWPNGPTCPHCGSFEVQCNIAHPSMTHRCRDCRKRPRFSVKTGTVMAGSKLGYQVWALATYLYSTGIKGVSSMKLHRDLNLTQKTAWFLAHRLRKSFESGESATLPFTGPVEADEVYIGGKESNKHESKKLGLGRGSVGKAPVAGLRDRDTGKVVAEVIPDTKKTTLQTFVNNHTNADAMVYSDDSKSYVGIDRPHETVCHSAKVYVDGQASTNGLESFWAMLKRGYYGIYHHLSVKHLHRYISEFACRHNIRDMDTADQMNFVVRFMVGSRLKYADLVS